MRYYTVKQSDVKMIAALYMRQDSGVAKGIISELETFPEIFAHRGCSNY